MLTGFCGLTCWKGTTFMSSITLGPNCATLPAWVMNIDTRPLGRPPPGSAVLASQAFEIPHGPRRGVHGEVEALARHRAVLHLDQLLADPPDVLPRARI